MPSPSAWGLLREGRGDGHLSWVLLLVGVGLNSLGDPDGDSSCMLRASARERLDW